jgi:hypothetical protein
MPAHARDKVFAKMVLDRFTTYSGNSFHGSGDVRFCSSGFSSGG